MTNDERTRAYRDTHLAKGWTKKADYRALKRAVAREVFAALAGRCAVPDYSDLRPARRAKNITPTTRQLLVRPKPRFCPQTLPERTTNRR